MLRNSGLKTGLWIVLGTLVSLTAVSGVTSIQNGRSPAAQLEACRLGALNHSHTDSNAAQLSAAEAEAMLAAYYQGFSLGERLKSRFDAMLAQRTPTRRLYSSETYAQLMVLRDRQEARIDTLVAYFEADLKNTIDRSQGRISARDLMGLVAKIDAELAAQAAAMGYPKTATLAYSVIVEDLESSVKQYADCIVSQSVSNLFPLTSRVSSEPSSRIEKFKREGLFAEVARETRQAELSIGTPASTAVDYSEENQVVEQARDMQKDLAEIFAPNRIVNDDAIRPGVDARGNVTGNGFPAKTWAFTFDDGPGATTPEVLDNLKKLGIKATFFVLAKNLQGAELRAHAMRAQAEGHAMASHSYTHANMPKVGAATQRHEIHDAAVDFRNRFGFRPKYYRLPYGAGMSIRSIRAQIANEGMIHVFWNVDTLDWQDRNPDSIVERAKAQIAQLNRGVVLFHDIHPQTVIASKKLIEFMKAPAQGTRFVTIPEIVDELNGVPAPAPTPVETPTPAPTPTASVPTVRYSDW